MCGIAGIHRSGGPVSDPDRTALARMLRALRHRGPDGEGLHEETDLLLGHRRLAVIDLSTAAGQPMPNETSELWLSFNGEIYNFPQLRSELLGLGHAFRSRTDAEVVLHGYEEWGMDGLLSRLRGMFAFALWDRNQRKLVLARDRFGIKPLYYAVRGSRLVFASELRALAASGILEVEPSEKALASFLLQGSIPAPDTALAGVLSIPAAHYLEISREGRSLKRYWSLPIGEPSPTDAGDMGELLRETVRMHLVSDVPLGVFLSGGIDSASLVAVASRFLQTPLTTLSVVFDDPSGDERAYARRVAETHGTRHHEVRIGTSELFATLPDFWAAMDQPTIDGVNAYVISRAAKQAGLTVVLTGLGGDEVFLGYPHFRRIRTWSTWIPWLAPLLRPWSRRHPRLEYLRNPTASNLYWTFRGLFGPREIREILPDARPAPPVAHHREPLDAAVELEFSRYLHDQLLRDTDLFSMVHSIEARVPFLDHVLAEAALRLPYAAKLGGRANKPVLLRSLDDPLPPEIWDRPKQGFTLPFRKLLADHREALLERTLAAGVFDERAVRRLWEDFSKGRAHWSRPWSLAAYGAWRKEILDLRSLEQPLPATAASFARG